MEDTKAYSYKEIKAFMEEDTLKLPFALKLKHPIEFGQEILTQIQFLKTPTAGDMMDMPAVGQVAGDSYKLIGKITNFEFPKVKRIAAQDMNRMQGILNYFLADSEEDGE